MLPAMVFTPTSLPGAFLVEPELHRDVRGLFARTWCREEFAAHGLNARLVQCNASFTERRGTVRGMSCDRVTQTEQNSHVFGLTSE